MAATSSAIAGPSQTAGSFMSAPQWRQFTFFDLEDVEDADELAQFPAAIRDLSPPIIITSTSPTSPVSPSVILSSGNTITLLDRHFHPDRSFRAWEGNGRGPALLEAGGLLVAIGEEEGSRYPVLKIWDLTRDEKKKAGGGPILLRSVRIQYGQRPHPVSAMALTSNLSHLAIGLGDGTVLLYRHLLQSLTTSPTALSSLPKARVIHDSAEPVTGLGFREPSTTPPASASRTPDNDKPNVSTLSLFIVTTNRVLCAPVSGRGGETRTIDELGCGLGCAVIDWERREMVVARDEAIYLYGPEGRGACYAYEGPKSSIAIFKHNLIITSPPFAPSASSASATVRHYVSKSTNGGDGSSDIAKVTIFDLQNKLVAYSGTFRDGVRDVFCQWGEIFIFGNNNKLSRLDEHSNSAKLDVLYRRNLYTLAITLAQSQGVSESGVADIHRRYGDYLYGKGDFDGAMGQYAKTLGYLQPSYFLDAQRIQNLTTYLQELHSRGLANPDHTTLLLNCYTKTGDRARLDTFIKTEAKRSDASGGGLDDLPFDLETAIRVCRQAGFFEHATYLARKYGRHEEYLRIQIEDAEQYEDALRYLRSLGPEACQENMVLYGKTLLQNVPEPTTDLLIDLCSGTLGRKPPPGYSVTDASKSPNGNGVSGPAVLSYLGYNRVAGIFSGDSPSTPSTATIPSSGTAAEGGKQPNGDGTSSRLSNAVEPDTGSAGVREEGPSYEPPSPRQYFAHFLDHRDLFIRFLEAVAKNLWNQAVPASSSSTSAPLSPRTEEAVANDETAIDQRAVWNTLLELYITSSTRGTKILPDAREKALRLLRSSLPFDPMHALILCSAAAFTDGLVPLWESMGMYEDVLRYYMAQPASSTPPPTAEVLRYLGLYGPSNPHLYPLVLRYLTSSPDILLRHSGELPKLLATIDELHVMPPLAIVQLLSRNGVTSVGSVKEWLREKVGETKQDVESDKQLVQSYRSETEAKQREIVDLANPRQPEVFQVTRCAACGGQLDLPSVHFNCKHSYHQRCLSDSDPECMLCSRQHAVIREIRRNQTRLADRHDLFLSEVHEADDGFAVVAGAFGRGIMGKGEGELVATRL